MRYRVIVAALQVIKPGFSVKAIPSVTKRLGKRNVAGCQSVFDNLITLRISDRNRVAPHIVGVLHIEVTAGSVQRRDILNIVGLCS